MADGEHDKESENPFSFKKFVHTKKPDTRPVKSDKRKTEKVAQEGATSNSKAKKDNFVDDVPFPDVAEVVSDSRKAESGTLGSMSSMFNVCTLNLFLYYDWYHKWMGHLGKTKMSPACTGNIFVRFLPLLNLSMEVDGVTVPMFLNLGSLRCWPPGETAVDGTCK